MKKTIVIAVLGILAVPSVAAAHGPPAITAGPSGTVNVRVAEFAFSYEEPSTDDTFECKIDGGAFEECGTIGPQGGEGTKKYTDLTDGEHTFSVRRIGPLPPPIGDTTESVRKWTVDTVAPETAITVAPVTSASTNARFEFASDAGVTFECALDGGEFKECASPFELTGLAVGAHKLAVRARDAAGNVEATVAEHAWSVTAPAAAPAPAGGTPAQPAAPVTSTAGALPAGSVPTVTVGKQAKKAKKVKRKKAKRKRSAKRKTTR